MPGPIGAAARDAVNTLFGEENQATKLLLAVCIAVFVFSTFEQGRLDLMGLSRRIAVRWGALEPRAHVFAPLRYLSANFVHFGLIHILLNAIMLWSFGRALEDRAGGARMTVVFFVTGIAGFVASDFVYSFGSIAAVTGGASAGIAGLIGAFIGHAFAQGNPVWKRALISIVLYSVAFAFAVPMRINHAAHVGGLVTGGLFGILLFKQRGRFGPVYAGLSWLLWAATALSLVLARTSS